jgi:hypothetical protein
MERRGFLGALAAPSLGAVLNGSLSLILPERKAPREPLRICLDELPRAKFQKAQL